MYFVGKMTAQASLSLHGAGFAEAACVELVIILDRRLPCLVPVGSSRESELQVLWSPCMRSLREVLRKPLKFCRCG